MSRTLVLMSLLIVASSARAQSIDEADAAYGAGELDRALSFYDRLLATGGLPASTTAHVHLRLGVLRASLEGAESARSHFDLALALDPSLAPPPELGPDAQALFTSLAAARAGQALELHLEPLPRTNESPLTLRISITAAPPGAIAALRISATPPGGAPWVERVEGTPSEVEVPAAAWRGAGVLALAVSALDAHGNAIGEASAQARAGTGAGADLGGPTAPLPGEDLWASPWLWLIVGVVVLGGAAAATTGIVLATAQDTYVLVPSVP